MKKTPPLPDSMPRWKHRVHEIIFEADTKLGKTFDVLLLIAIVTSVTLFCIESTFPTTNPSENDVRWLLWLDAFEWVFTILFTIEYALRIACVRNPIRYIFSFYGIVDLLAILPNYIGLLTTRGSSLSVIRALRLIRVFRVFKLVWLMSEADELGRAIWSARGKVIVFLGVVAISIVVSGTAMYEIEGPENGFYSIPDSMYWATVTMTTVGYGDITPKTGLGKSTASLLILLGYSLIIVPTGFVSAEFISEKTRRQISTQVCHNCVREGHDRDATFCKYCGEKL